jgi:hypothetical protein
MKYLVKNVTTGEETLCEKVVVDGFDYYVSDSEPILESDIFMFPDNFLERASRGFDGRGLRKVIATINPSLDLPQVLGEVEELAKSEHSYNHKSVQEIGFRLGFVMGYKQAKETYSYTKKDLIDFKQQAPLILEQMCAATDEELFDIWKEQRTITISVK